jgi:hypothetical protein
MRPYKKGVPISQEPAGIIRHKKSLVWTLIGVMLSIAGGLTPFIFIGDKFLNGTPFEKNPAFASLFFALVVYMLTDKITALYAAIESDEILVDLLRPVIRRVECSHIGTYREAYTYFRSRLAYAETIKDVTIMHGVRSQEKDLFFWNSTHMVDMKSAIIEWVNTGKIYRGIFSKNILDVFERDFPVSKDNRNLLVIQETSGDLPALNFCILEYSPREDDREVLFGWGHHAHDERGHVFSSMSPQLVDTFDRLFSSLSESAKDVEVSSETDEVVKQIRK